MNRSQETEENQRDERLDYCARIVEMMCHENPACFVELVKAGMRGIERAHRQEAKEAQGVSNNL